MAPNDKYSFNKKVIGAMERALIIYHRQDLDGTTSCAQLLRYTSDIKEWDTSVVGMAYNEPIPWDEINAADYVYIVDFSFSPDEMKEIQSKVKRLTWIDHHVSAIDKVKTAGLSFPGIQRIDRAACYLTYEYLSSISDEVKQELYPHGPSVTLQLLEQYDRTGPTDGDIPSFALCNMGVQAANWTDVRSELYDKILIGNPDQSDRIAKGFIADGRVIYGYNKNSWAIGLRGSHIARTIHGKRALTANNSNHSSAYFESMKNEDFDMYISWYINTSMTVTFSFYSDTIDVGAIAVEHGGGGHKGASGCTMSIVDAMEFLQLNK